jgi:hypothetical protein
MIDQLPREVTVASLDRSKTVKTATATFAVRHLPPPLFGGFELQDGVPTATPEKALFDYYYVARASLRARRRLPELELPRSFSDRRLRTWIDRIDALRLRREVDASLNQALATAAKIV